MRLYLVECSLLRAVQYSRVSVRIRVIGLGLVVMHTYLYYFRL